MELLHDQKQIQYSSEQYRRNQHTFEMGILIFEVYVRFSSEEKLYFDVLFQTPYIKTLINVMVDFTPLRRHPRVNKDERTCTYTHVLPTCSFSHSSNTDEN